MGLNREELSEKIAGLIRSKKEGKTWDFKEKWYKDKKDFVRTILAMANNATIDDSYIIIGVKDKSCLPSDGSDWRKGAFKQTSDLNNWLRDIPFDNFNYPDLELETAVKVRAKVDGTEHDYSLDVIVIKSTANVPYYLSSDLQCKKGVKKQEIYIRMKDQNVLATPLELEELYRKKFGLTLSIRDRFELLLSDTENWDYALYEPGCEPWDTRSMYVFHKHFPKFFIEMDFSDKRFSEQKIPPLPFLNEEDVDVCIHGLLKLFYDKFLIERFHVYYYQISFGIQWLRVYFVNPLPAKVFDYWPKCTDEVKYIFYYFVKNDTGFNLNNILKKIFQNGEQSFYVTCHGVVNRSIYGLDHEALEEWEKLFKKNVIYFEDEEEKLEYKKFIEKNRKAICNELTSTKDTKNEREVNRFFVEHFHKWKFAKLLEEKNNWKIHVKKSVHPTCTLLGNTLHPTCTLLTNTLYCNDFNLRDFPRLYNVLNKFTCFFDEFKIIVICNNTLCYGAYFQNLEDHFYKFNTGLCVGVGGGEYNFRLISPNKNEHDDFPYLYIFKDSIEFKINDILLHTALTSSETSDIVKKCARECDEIFKNCVIYFENKEEKQKFDRYLQENRDDILEKINDFYKENCQEFEKNCRERVLKIERVLKMEGCPEEFSSEVEIMVERGVFAEKIAEFFRCWKNGKNNDNQGDLKKVKQELLKLL